MKTKSSISKTFLRGLLGLLPLSLSIYFVLWFFKAAEHFVNTLLPFTKSIPGTGIVTAIVLTFGMGTLLSSSRFYHFFKLAQLPLRNIPLIKSIYSAIEDLTIYFSKADEKHEDQVVVVTLPNVDIQFVGLATREDFSEIESNGILNDQSVAVFIPMSYGLGGYTIFVPKKFVKKIPMKVEVAMKSALTAWMKKKPEGTV